jgi:hypothetical protein
MMLAAVRIRCFSAVRWRICMKCRRCEHRTEARPLMLDDGRTNIDAGLEGKSVGRRRS